jgi:curved DNA-binding protein CbpA
MEETLMASHYEVLGVAADASDAEIKSAYRRQARVHHPDGGGDALTMGLVNEAYDVLRDSRAAYDRSLIEVPADISSAERGRVEPEDWGVEEDDWGDVVPGRPQHLANESEHVAPSDRLVQPSGRNWGWGVIGVLILTGALIALYMQFQENHLTAPHIRLLAPLVAFAALAQLFKPKFRTGLQAILCLGILGGVLSIFGVWPLGPISGVGLLLLGPSVWTIRFGPSGWGKSGA